MQDTKIWKKVKTCHMLFVFTVEVVFVGISMSFNGIIHQATGEADWTVDSR